jgi:hypothetical protein
MTLVKGPWFLFPFLREPVRASITVFLILVALKRAALIRTASVVVLFSLVPLVDCQTILLTTGLGFGVISFRFKDGVSAAARTRKNENDVPEECGCVEKRRLHPFPCCWLYLCVVRLEDSQCFLLPFVPRSIAPRAHH